MKKALIISIGVNIALIIIVLASVFFSDHDYDQDQECTSLIYRKLLGTGSSRFINLVNFDQEDLDALGFFIYSADHQGVTIATCISQQGECEIWKLDPTGRLREWRHFYPQEFGQWTGERIIILEQYSFREEFLVENVWRDKSDDGELRYQTSTLPRAHGNALCLQREVDRLIEDLSFASP